MLVEVVKVSFLFNISLKQLQDVSSKCFHWLDHALIAALVHSLTDALRVLLVHSNNIGEYHAEVRNVMLTNT